MEDGEATAARKAALFLDRYRATIEAEVDRRMGQREPPPHARAEIVRRFRSFCRLASIHPQAARPSLDGLGGNSPEGLERAIKLSVEIACECGPDPAVEQALRSLESRFRSGLRRILQPRPPQERRSRKHRNLPNAGKRVRAAIDRIGDAYVALWIDTGGIYDLNPAAETMLGGDASALLERKLADLVHAEERAEFGELEARLDAGEDAGPMDLRLVRLDGDAVRVQLSVSSHTIAGKRLAIFVAREQGEKQVSPRPPGPSGLAAAQARLPARSPTLKSVS
jgi:PAS domain S-box-containing protein